MTYFLIFNDTENCFVSNIVCSTRIEANKWCDVLESNYGGIFIPVKFVDGVQVGRL